MDTFTTSLFHNPNLRENISEMLPGNSSGSAPFLTVLEETDEIEDEGDALSPTESNGNFATDEVSILAEIAKSFEDLFQAIQD